MKHLVTSALICLALSVCHATLQAQKKDTTVTRKSHWDVGLTYLSNDVYLGRKDSVAVPYLSPSISYHDRSGLFISGGFSYLSSPGNNRIDVAVIEGGYSYESDKVNVELTAGKDFYNGQSFAVSSGIGGRVSSYFSYDFGIIEPSLELGADFSDGTDFVAGLGLEHSFTIVEDQLEIDPSFKVNAATQNFYNSYFKNNRYNAHRVNKNVSGTVTGSITNASRFQVMDYEWSASVDYTWNKRLKVNFTPTLAMPTNPSVVTVTTRKGAGSSTQNYRESLSNTFYWSLGVTYSFISKRRK